LFRETTVRERRALQSPQNNTQKGARNDNGNVFREMRVMERRAIY
jgi:hypothetical protein